MNLDLEIFIMLFIDRGCRSADDGHNPLSIRIVVSIFITNSYHFTTLNVVNFRHCISSCEGPVVETRILVRPW